MDYVSGRFGWSMVAEYVKVLHSFPTQGIHNLADQFFNLGIQATAEAWRRYVSITSAYPFAVFRLVDLDDERFWQECLAIEAMGSKCGQCIDIEFTKPIVKFIRGDLLGVDGNHPEVKERISKVRQLLLDISIHSPISSDLVECLHGYCQRLLGRSGPGAKPTDQSAQERVLWGLVSKAYSKVRQCVFNYFGDKHALYRFAAFGNRAGNQYSRSRTIEMEGTEHSAPARRKLPLSTEKMDRLLAFGQESDVYKPRKLCGYIAAS